MVQCIVRLYINDNLKMILVIELNYLIRLLFLQYLIIKDITVNSGGMYEEKEKKEEIRSKKLK